MSRLARILVTLVVLGGATAAAPAQGQFVPFRSVWSRLSAQEIPEGLVEPTAEELASELGLTPAGTCDAGTPLFRHDKLGMLFVFVPGGRFMVGSDDNDLRENTRMKGAASRAKEADQLKWEQPKIEVYVSSFFMGYTEVTVAQYRRFLEAVERGEVTPFEYPTPELEQTHVPHFWDEIDGYYDDDHPVSCMTWYSAYAFCQWMGGRLPTEYEWERAARGDDDRLFPWGNTFDPMRTNTNESIGNRPVPVGTYPGGRSPYGCRNMAGNVCEFVMDAWEKSVYRHAPRKDPCLLEREPATTWRIVKGSSHNTVVGFQHRARGSARSRLRMLPNVPREILAGMVEDFLHFGFRVALSPTQNLYPEGWLEERRQQLATESKKDQTPEQASLVPGAGRGGSSTSSRSGTGHRWSLGLAGLVGLLFLLRWLSRPAQAA